MISLTLHKWQQALDISSGQKEWNLKPAGSSGLFIAPIVKTQEDPLTSDLFFSMVQFALGAPFHGQPAFPSPFPSSLVILTCDHPGQQERQALP